MSHTAIKYQYWSCWKCYKTRSTLWRTFCDYFLFIVFSRLFKQQLDHKYSVHHFISKGLQLGFHPLEGNTGRVKNPHQDQELCDPPNVKWSKDDCFHASFLYASSRFSCLDIKASVTLFFHIVKHNHPFHLTCYFFICIFCVLFSSCKSNEINFNKK